MGHYDKREVKLRCDGDHTWTDEFLEKSSIDIELHNGEVCVVISWCIAKRCQNKHTNNVPSVYSRCQKQTIVDRCEKYIPVDSL